MSSARVLLASLVLVTLPAVAAEDLRALEVRGLRGQSQEQARRDRYECHNWAVAQTGGQAPPTAPAAAPPDAVKADLRHERIGRAIVGATIGGTIGALTGDWHDQNEHILAGAALGAGIGAATAGAGRKEPPPLEGPSDYLRALTACLEGRGYSVSLPGLDLTASL